MSEKYDAGAERFTEREYGDPERYFGRRAALVASLGPALSPGDTVLDLACADGAAAPSLLARGLRYLGVDASAAMVDVARRRHELDHRGNLPVPPDPLHRSAARTGAPAALGRLRSGSDPGETEGTLARDPGQTEGTPVRFERGDLAAYEPPRPVAATTIFRSLHFVGDRVAFFRRVAAFTERKLVFDVSPRRYSLPLLRAELAEAGFPVLVTRPFLVPQHARLPAPAAALLAAAERTPLGRLAVRYRFTLICAAFEPGSNSKPTTAPTTRESEIP